jgi:5,10-methylenetetrahydromethanopterin reductase
VTADRLGLGFLGFPDIRQLAELGRTAEAVGFESVWVAETRITRDAITGMTSLLMATERLRVGSAAINVFTRGAALTAVTWATMAEAAPGRLVLGIGPGSPTPLAQQGYPFEDALSRLREFVEAVRAAWSHPAPVDYTGRFFRLSGLTPEVIPEAIPPIYFCVTGPQALEAAGAAADGVVLNAFMPPGYVERARERLDDGAGGRFEGEVAGALVVTIAESLPEAAARVRPILATYLAFFPHLAKQTGLDPDFLERIQRIAREEGLAATFGMLPDQLVAEHALCGTVGDCKQRLADYRASGLELPVLFPDPDSVLPVIDRLS